MIYFRQDNTFHNYFHPNFMQFLHGHNFDFYMKSCQCQITQNLYENNYDMDYL